MTQPELVNATDVAEMLDVSRMTVTVWVRKGRLPKPQRVGGQLIFRRDEIEEIAEMRKKLRNFGATGDQEDRETT